MLFNRTKLVDILSGKNVNDYYMEYDKTQWYSKGEMKEYQLMKLKKLLKHCYNNVPYYNRIIKERGIDINNITSTNILEKFPVLTKEIIQNNYKDFIPKNINHIKGVKISQTGGTTGNILLKRTDANVRSSAWATYKRFQDWMGISGSTKILRLMGGHVAKHSLKDNIKEYIFNIVNNTISLNPYDKSDKNIKRIQSVLENKGISSIKGYSQSLFFLARLFEDRSVSFNIDSITTTAEPLMDEHRMKFKKVFGAESFDQYGCGEIGSIAYECNHHKGLHVAEERVILEFKDNIDLLITDLDNYAMPYIRYWNADQAIVSKEECTCGRKTLLLSRIMGRTCDYISCSDGKQLHWAYFWHLLFDTGIAAKRNMVKFQVLQNNINELNFRIVSNPLQKEDKDIIVNNMKMFIGKDIKVTFIQEKDIENAKSGKYRPVINNMI